jgi:hypothetical protein
MDKHGFVIEWHFSSCTFWLLIPLFNHHFAHWSHSQTLPWSPIWQLPPGSEHVWHRLLQVLSSPPSSEHASFTYGHNGLKPTIDDNTKPTYISWSLYSVCNHSPLVCIIRSAKVKKIMISICRNIMHFNQSSISSPKVIENWPLNSLYIVFLSAVCLIRDQI